MFSGIVQCTGKVTKITAKKDMTSIEVTPPKNFNKNFQINDKLMKYAKKNAIFMHCLPANRNEEVAESVIDVKQSVIWQQAKNRMYIQQSILNFCIK